MKLRLILIILGFLGIFALFSFSSSFNWSGAKHISVYHQFFINGDYLNFLRYSVVPSVIALIALLFLFVGSKS